MAETDKFGLTDFHDPHMFPPPRPHATSIDSSCERIRDLIRHLIERKSHGQGDSTDPVTAAWMPPDGSVTGSWHGRQTPLLNFDVSDRPGSSVSPSPPWDHLLPGIFFARSWDAEMGGWGAHQLAITIGDYGPSLRSLGPSILVGVASERAPQPPNVNSSARDIPAPGRAGGF